MAPVRPDGLNPGRCRQLSNRLGRERSLHHAFVELVVTGHEDDRDCLSEVLRPPGPAHGLGAGHKDVPGKDHDVAVDPRDEGGTELEVQVRKHEQLHVGRYFSSAGRSRHQDRELGVPGISFGFGEDVNADRRAIEVMGLEEEVHMLIAPEPAEEVLEP